MLIISEKCAKISPSRVQKGLKCEKVGSFKNIMECSEGSLKRIQALKLKLISTHTHTLTLTGCPSSQKHNLPSSSFVPSWDDPLRVLRVPHFVRNWAPHAKTLTFLTSTMPSTAVTLRRGMMEMEAALM